MDDRTPPPLEPARHALFLDFDGSIVDFAPKPDMIVLRPGTIALLENASRRLGGALAIVSGRQIADLDRHLAPLKIPASGVHGLEFRPSFGDLSAAPLSNELDEARRRLTGAIGPTDRIFLEDKGGALVLHYRAHPDQRGRAERLARNATRDLDTLRVMAGHAIFEILQRHITKADALQRFMRRPPFHGRIPVFVGDDATDEDGFRAAAAEGGFGVKIGPGKSAAAYRLQGSEAVHQWLSRLTGASLPAGTAAASER
jgi:trehalose 6-phosphate phosphatase